MGRGTGCDMIATCRGLVDLLLLFCFLIRGQMTSSLSSFRQEWRGIRGGGRLSLQARCGGGRGVRRGLLKEGLDA